MFYNIFFDTTFIKHHIYLVKAFLATNRTGVMYSKTMKNENPRKSPREPPHSDTNEMKS